VGGTPIYTHFHTFWRDLHCQPDSAAALKTPKNYKGLIRGRDIETKGKDTSEKTI
jgi:hypothetical protein